MKTRLLSLSLVFCMLLVGSSVFAQDETETPTAPVLGAINIIVSDVWVTPADGGDEVVLSESSSFDLGETLRTDEQGVALVTWFYDGTESAVGQNTSLKLNDFSGDAAETFVIDAELKSGHLTTSLGSVAESSLMAR